MVRERDPSFYVSALLELADASVPDRRALWRQAMAALSRAGAEGGPGPLEGLHPDVLLRGVQVALASGLADDLDWLSPQAAGIALYTLASALPASSEQRDLGRRVLARMLAGNAESFCAMATIMAQTGGKGLGSPAIRARIRLVCELPIHHGIADGALALALVSRRDDAREWVAGPSTRSLPARRLAAKILERAAREAAKRAQMGDTHAMKAFAGDAVKTAFGRLLADRESLVWRYVAVARGLGAPWIPEWKAEIQASLAEGLSPTEWRRGAASLAAMAAVDPDYVLETTKALAKRGFFSKEDRPSAAAFLWGIPRAIEAEPDIATKLVDLVASADAAEAAAELTFEYGPSKVVDRAARACMEALKSSRGDQRGEDDGQEALWDAIDAELAGRPKESLRAEAARALDAFVTESAPAAYAKARNVLSAAKGGMDALEAVAKDDDAPGRVGAIARRTSMAVLRDLDAGLLERSAVADMLKLGGSSEQVRASEFALDAIRERFAEWIVACETPELTSSPTSRPSLRPGSMSRPPPAMPNSGIRHTTLRMRRLRALLHLLDGDLGEGTEAITRKTDGDEVERAKRLRALWLRTVKALLDHFDRDAAPVLRRTLLATLARALDALVRLGVCDVIDALLLLAGRIKATNEFETLAEASMDPDLRHVLTRYARFLRDCEEVRKPGKVGGDSSAPPPSLVTQTSLAALDALAAELAPEASARSEALRTVLVRLHASLVAVEKASSLRALASSGTSDADVIGNVETWVAALAQMCAGAKSRLDPAVPSMPASAPSPRLISSAISRVLGGHDAILTEDALAPAVDELLSGVPYAIATILGGILWQVLTLPIDRPSLDGGMISISEQLPAWLPPRRTIGGFYVVRSLGVGGTASVFVVNRVEDKSDPRAERFALKVPEYNATAARTVSQEEFSKLFREEASALIMMPSHVNLARFVTFDLASRPLPILVMELVEGVTLERVLDQKNLDMKRCLQTFDDILAGLEAMHSVGLGHLDIKPSNVVMRAGQQGVLVDFGLAGRKIRQGCGTGPYGAPEVWGVVPDDFPNPPPMASDIYAFGCLAFEMLTGQILFAAANEVMQITMHISHDGSPPPMQSLVANPEIGPLAELLVPTLRRDPRLRPSAEDLRRDIKSVAAMVGEAKWPVEVGGNR